MCGWFLRKCCWPIVSDDGDNSDGDDRRVARGICLWIYALLSPRSFLLLHDDSTSSCVLFPPCCRRFDAGVFINIAFHFLLVLLTGSSTDSSDEES